MELDPTKFKFSNVYMILSFVLILLSPFIVFMLLYDKGLTFRIDTFKLIAVSIAVGVPLFIFNQFICTILLWAINKVMEQKTEKIEGSFDMPDIFAILFYMAANFGTLANMVHLKYFLHLKKEFWITASIETWLLIEIVIVGICSICILGIWMLKLYARKRKRAKK